MRAMFAATLVLLGLVSSVAHAGDQASPVQYTRDSRATLVQKNVNGERWAITYEIESGHVTGNVLLPDGGTTFLDCDRVEVNDDVGTFSCYAADGCGASCGEDAWEFLTRTELPLSFFFPPAADAFCCQIPLPGDVTTCVAQGPSPQACVTVGNGTFFEDSTCVRTSEPCPGGIPGCFLGTCQPLP